MKDFLNNFVAQKCIYLGKEMFQLRIVRDGVIGEIYEPFETASQALIEKGTPKNTMKQYQLRVAGFVDVVYECRKENDIDVSRLNLLYRNYHSYLTVGCSSASEMVRAICRTKPSPMIAVSSSGAYHAPIDGFIKHCKERVKEASELFNSGIEIFLDPDVVLFSSVREVTVSVSDREAGARAQRLQGSRGSDRATTKTTLSPHVPRVDRRSEPLRPNKYFPLDGISELIESAPTYMEGALWSLCAAIGVRESEAVQVLRKDIDLELREVSIIQPATRDDYAHAYRGLTEVEKNKLAWKGRDTPESVMLEPYRTKFFLNLEMYKKYEYDASANHNFLFQDKNGRPLFLADYSGIVRSFQKAAYPIVEKSGLIVKRFGLHSLRHSYIHFMKNHLVHSHGVGLDDHQLIMLTGHADTRSLKPYASADREKLLTDIGVANIKRRQQGDASEIHLQIEYLESRLESLKRKAMADHVQKGSRK